MFVGRVVSANTPCHEVRFICKSYFLHSFLLRRSFSPIDHISLSCCVIRKIARLRPVPALPALGHLHALLPPAVLDALHDFELVSQGHAHLFQVLLVHLQDGLEVLHAVVQQGVLVLEQVDPLQEVLYFLEGSVLFLQGFGQVVRNWPLYCCLHSLLFICIFLWLLLLRRLLPHEALTALAGGDTGGGLVAVVVLVLEHEAGGREEGLLLLVVAEHHLGVAGEALGGGGAAPHGALVGGLHGVPLLLLQLHHLLHHLQALLHHLRFFLHYL